MLVDWQFLMHNFCTVMNGEAVAFWEDQSEVSLALIMALAALGPGRTKHVTTGTVHAFVCMENRGLPFRMQIQNLAPCASAHCDICWVALVKSEHFWPEWTHSTAWQVKWLFSLNTSSLQDCHFGFRSAAWPRLCTDKNRSPVNACICVHAPLWLHAHVRKRVKIHKGSRSHCGWSQIALRWRGSRHFNKSGPKHDTGRRTDGKKKSKDQQNKGATRITSSMSFKQGMVFDNQHRGRWIARLRPHLGHFDFDGGRFTGI